MFCNLVKEQALLGEYYTAFSNIKNWSGNNMHVSPKSLKIDLSQEKKGEYTLCCNCN